MTGINIDITDRNLADATLRERERMLRLAMRVAGAGIWTANPASGAFRASERALEIYGLPPGTPMTHEAALNVVGPDDRPAVEAALRHTQETGEPFRMELRILRPNGSHVWISWNGERVEEGDATSLIGIVRDVTERRQGEERLRAANDTFRHLVERSPFGLYTVDADFRLAQVSDGAQKAFDTVRPLIGRDFAEVLRIAWPEPFATEIEGRFRHTLATGEPDSSSSTIERRADRDIIEAYDWKIERITMPDNRQGLVCHFYDLSERQRHEAHVQLLMGEINHRSKNMLSLIQAIARHTAATGAPDFLARFRERVQSLATGQDLLVRNEWRSVPLADLARSQLAHFADLVDTRIRIAGPDLAVTPAAAQALGLVLHELATNASKYGALSTGTGGVAIRWHIADAGASGSHVEIEWVEQGGPPVAAPSRPGFGSTLTTGMAESSMGGTVTVDYAPGGFSWRLVCPLGNIAADLPNRPGAVVRPAPPHGADHPHAGRRVLVVDDEPLIAAEIAAVLAEAGCEVLGPVATVDQALALLARQHCDAAVLDVTLGSETCEPVAHLLAARATPFVLVSGYSRAQLPALLRTAPLVGKPLDPVELEVQIEKCLRQAAPLDVANGKGGVG